MSRITFPTPRPDSNVVASVETSASQTIDVSVSSHDGESIITVGPYELDLADAERLRLALSGAMHLVRNGVLSS
jgi:hypothetical protein